MAAFTRAIRPRHRNRRLGRGHPFLLWDGKRWSSPVGLAQYLLPNRPSEYLSEQRWRCVPDLTNLIPVWTPYFPGCWEALQPQHLRNRETSALPMKRTRGGAWVSGE